MIAPNDNSADRSAITKLVELYVADGKSGKGDDMPPAYHKDATLFGYIGPDLVTGPLQGLYDWHDQNGAPTGLVATVRVELDNRTGHRSTDFFTRLKVDGGWKILNKVFRLYGWRRRCTRRSAACSRTWHYLRDGTISRWKLAKD